MSTTHPQAQRAAALSATRRVTIGVVAAAVLASGGVGAALYQASVASATTTDTGTSSDSGSSSDWGGTSPSTGNDSGSQTSTGGS